MSRFFVSAPPTLVDQVIQRRPTHHVKLALSALRDTVEFNINDGFRGNEPPKFSARWAWGLFPLGVFIALGGVAITSGMSSAAAFVAFLVTTFGIGVPMMFGSVAYLSYKSRPASQLDTSRRVLEKASRGIADATRSRLKRFAALTERLFLVAGISTVQERIRGGDGLSPRRLRKLEKEGLSLVDEAASALRLSPPERGQLKAAFQAGQMPRPEEYLRVLDAAHGSVQDRIAALHP